MKVIFKVIKAGSGNDVYFERLSQALRKINIDSVIEYYPAYFQFFPWLLKFVNKKKQADVIHTNVEYGWVFKEKNKPLYITLHHNVFEKNYRKCTTIAQRFFHDFILKPNIKKSLNIASKIIAVSNYTKKSFIQDFGNYSIEVVYNFIDTDKYKQKKVISTDKRFTLLFVGNLTKRKGADLLPQIMSRLGKKYVLYYTSGLRTKVPKEFKLPNMIPLGKLSEEELIVEYNKCDALLFPTRLEGFGYAVAETMVCEKPVVTTNVSSIPELVTDGENGYLCRTENVEEFVEKIILLARNEQIQQKMSLQNRKRILSHFSLYSLQKQIENIYL